MPRRVGYDWVHTEHSRWGAREMDIACIAWGSLVWDPRDLPFRGCWSKDGPFLPVEFARQSCDGRITLFITPGSRRVTTLWRLLSVQTLVEAKEALRAREKTSTRHIGFWCLSDSSVDTDDLIVEWAKRVDVDAAVWTNLPPKFDGQERTPREEDVVPYLRGLQGKQRDRAEEYVRRAPPQIDTDYRRAIAAKLGWTPAVGRQG